MFAVCFRYTKDEERSKEIVQEVFKSVWERRNSLQIQGPPEHYLVRASKLKMMEGFRSETKVKEHLSAVGYLQPQSEHTTSNQILFNEQVKLLDSGVAELPEKCRQVFQLSQQSMLSHTQIALGLNISNKTVENYLSQANQLLRKKIRLSSK